MKMIENYSIRKTRQIQYKEDLINKFLQYIQSNKNNGGKSMYQYTFNAATDKKVLDELNKTTTSNKKKVSSLEELQGSFDDIDKGYNLNSPSDKIENTLDLKKLESVDIDKEKIYGDALSSLADEKDATKQGIVDDVVKKSKELETNKESLKTSANDQKARIEKLYAERKKEANADAIKRGLASSSIIINQLDAFDSQKIKDYISIDKELSSSINKINEDINSLTLEKDKALKDYDIAYATKLNDKIASLTKDLNAQQEKVIKYNNEIAEKEAEYEADRIKQNATIDSSNTKKYLDLSEFIKDNGASALQSLKNQEKFNIALEYFTGIPKNEAINLLTENSAYYKTQLGTQYYNLLSHMRERS